MSHGGAYAALESDAPPEMPPHQLCILELYGNDITSSGARALDNRWVGGGQRGEGTGQGTGWVVGGPGSYITGGQGWGARGGGGRPSGGQA